MSYLSRTPFLALTLKLDAAVSGACAIALLIGVGFLAGLLGLPETLLTAVGAFLLAYGVFLLVLAERPQPPAALVWMVIVGNALWVVASIALMLGGWFAMTGLGYAFVIVQAVAVGAFAELQYMAVRRSPTIA